MVDIRTQPTVSRRSRSSFRIEGQIQREQPESQPGELQLAVYVFDTAGTLVGSAYLDKNGKYSVAVRLEQPADVDLIVGPADMPQQIRCSSAYRKTFSAKDWWKAETDGQFRLSFDTLLPVAIWYPWWPLHICISGHVRKVNHHDGVTDICPVPFEEVEIFDKNGVKLTSAVLPPMTDHYDQVLQIDNVTPTLTPDVPKAGEDCGVVKFTDLLFDNITSVTQANLSLSKNACLDHQKEEQL